MCARASERTWHDATHTAHTHARGSLRDGTSLHRTHLLDLSHNSRRPFPVAALPSMWPTHWPGGGTLFRNYLAQALVRARTRQTGPRGVAPGRGPYALLHDGTLALIIAQ